MSEATKDTNAGDVVSIQVPPDPPYGVKFIPDTAGNAAVLQSFEVLPSGRFGPIQKHGGIHYGDVLIEINDQPLQHLKHDEVMRLIMNRNTLKKVFKFMNSKEYYRKKTASSVRVTAQENKNAFFSAVKRSRLGEEVNGKKFAEYEIACQYRLVGMKVQKEVVYQWTLWKRYSEFESLHSKLRKTLGWQVDTIEFPPAHTFVMNKLSPEFIDQRREALKQYWQKVLAVDKVTDFAKHHCSHELKEFLEVEANIMNKGIAATADMVSEEEQIAEVAASSVPPSNARRASARNLSRRISARNGKITEFNYEQNASGSGTTKAPAITNTVDSDANVSPSQPQAPSSNAGPAPPPPPSAPTAQAPPPPPPKAAVPPPPPPKAAVAPPPPPAPSGGSGSSLPKATGARLNLLGDINKLRKD